MIRSSDPALSRSTAFGRPSFTLNTVLTGRPAARIIAAVPRVAVTSKPSSLKRRASGTANDLSRSFTLRNTRPFARSGVPALNCALATASPKFSPTPITSPVDRISGPSVGSTPGNLLNGNTGDLTKNFGTLSTPVALVISAIDLPSINPTAIFGSATPVALLTYGAVREARGFTSSTY